MDRLNRISSSLVKYANKRYIVPVLILFVCTLVVMENNPNGSIRLKEVSDGIGMLDMRFGYGPAMAYGMLEKIGDSGRILYRKLLGFDFFFILVYTALQSLLITSLARKASLPDPWQKVNLIPLVRSLLDVIENILLLFLIARFPSRHPLAVWTAGVLTAVKLAVNYGYVGIVFFLGAWTTRKSMMSKSAKRNTERRAA